MITLRDALSKYADVLATCGGSESPEAVAYFDRQRQSMDFVIVAPVLDALCAKMKK